MKTIPNKNMSAHEVKTLLTKGKITSGGEATICKGENPHTLYKIFESFGEPIAMGYNKERKIIELYVCNPDYTVKPISTISLDGTIIGYELTDEYTFDSFKNDYDLWKLDKNELRHFLNETKRILEYFSSKDIIYGDITPRNILFNRYTGEIKFCDIDNIQIYNYKMDMIPFILADYYEFRDIDDGVHPYMHNFMTLNALGLDLYCSTTHEFRKSFKRPGRKVIESMKNIETFNDEYIITHLKNKL